MKACVFTVLSEHFKLDMNQASRGLHLLSYVICSLHNIFINTRDDHNHSFVHDRLLSCQLFPITDMSLYTWNIF